MTTRARFRTLPTVFAAVTLLSSAACSGGSGGSDPASGGQDTPASVVEGVYRHVAAGEFEKACGLVLPELRDAYARQAGSCQAWVAGESRAEERPGLRDAHVDQAKIEANGDVVTVPENAITFGGRASSDGAVKLVKQNGRWWVSGGG